MLKLPEDAFQAVQVRRSTYQTWVVWAKAEADNTSSVRVFETTIRTEADGVAIFLNRNNAARIAAVNAAT
jgi:hypothetical protein